MIDRTGKARERAWRRWAISSAGDPGGALRARWARRSAEVLPLLHRRPPLRLGFAGNNDESCRAHSPALD